MRPGGPDRRRAACLAHKHDRRRRRNPDGTDHQSARGGRTAPHPQTAAARTRAHADTPAHTSTRRGEMLSTSSWATRHRSTAPANPCHPNTRPQQACPTCGITLRSVASTGPMHRAFQ
eukprot:2152540-Prymnesium_polylepis.2